MLIISWYVQDARSYHFLVAPIQTLVSIDEVTQNSEKLEYARSRVRLPIGCQVWRCTDIKINGTVRSSSGRRCIQRK